jgi:hypothetical protein
LNVNNPEFLDMKIDILVRIGLVVGSLILTLTSAEIALRIVDRPKPQDLIAGWRNVGKGTHVNQLGMRGKAIDVADSDHVIILLGDSQVEAGLSPDDSMPENFLENRLRESDPHIKVFSLAAMGYGNDQEYLVLQEYFERFRADAVLLWQTFNNDVWNNVFPTNWPKNGVLKPTFWLENGVLKGPNYLMGEVVQPSPHMKLAILIRRLIPLMFDEKWEQRLPKAYEAMTDYSGPYRRDWIPNENEYPYLGDENLGTEKSHFAVYLKPRSPRMQYGLDLTHALEEQIQSICARNRSEFIIFYYEPDSDKWPWEEQHEVIERIGNRFYRASNVQCRENQDYANRGFRMIKIPLTMRSWRISKFGSHLNVRANEVVMRSLADSLVSCLSHDRFSSDQVLSHRLSSSAKGAHAHNKR